MESEELIEEIRKCPVLYDQANEKYRNVDYKERVWKMISVNVHAEGGAEECKKRWNSIRDQLRRTLRKRKTKSGQAAAKARKYKYEDILTFLIPHLGEREDLSNVPQEVDVEDNYFEDSTDSQDTQEAEENISNSEEHHNEDQPGPSKDAITRTIDSASPNTTSGVSAGKRKFITSSPKNKNRFPGREMKPQDSPASHQLMAYILADKDAEKKANTQTYKQDSVDAFLCGIGVTLKSFDPVLLNEAKGKIFGIVQELELRQLNINAGNHV